MKRVLALALTVLAAAGAAQAAPIKFDFKKELAGHDFQISGMVDLDEAPWLVLDYGRYVERRGGSKVW